MALDDKTAAIIAAQLATAHVIAIGDVDMPEGPFDSKDSAIQRYVLAVYRDYLKEISGEPRSPSWA